MKIGPQELTEWKHHPVTKEIFRHLNGLIESSRDRWAGMSFDGEALMTDPATMHMLAQNRAYLKGQTQLCQDIIAIEIEDLYGAQNDEPVGD